MLVFKEDVMSVLDKFRLNNQVTIVTGWFKP